MDSGEGGMNPRNPRKEYCNSLPNAASQKMVLLTDVTPPLYIQIGKHVPIYDLLQYWHKKPLILNSQILAGGHCACAN